MSVTTAELMSRAWMASPLLTQCAWCGAVLRGSGFSDERFPVTHRLEGRRVTHGICPPCLHGVLATRPDSEA